MSRLQGPSAKLLAEEPLAPQSLNRNFLGETHARLLKCQCDLTAMVRLMRQKVGEPANRVPAEESHFRGAGKSSREKLGYGLA